MVSGTRYSVQCVIAKLRRDGQQDRFSVEYRRLFTLVRPGLSLGEKGKAGEGWSGYLKHLEVGLEQWNTSNRLDRHEVDLKR